VLLYHLHFDVPDVRAAEAEWEERGFPVVARFGYVGDEHRRFEPDTGWEELADLGLRLRLVELERGAVNVVLMRSRFPERRLGQIGFATTEEEQNAALERAATSGARMRDRGFRSFVASGQRFDFELTAHERHEYGPEALAELRLEGVVVRCGDPANAAALARVVAGDEARRLEFVAGESDFAELASWSLSGRFAESEVSVARPVEPS
jgi:hypothetical protein